MFVTTNTKRKNSNVQNKLIPKRQTIGKIDLRKRSILKWVYCRVGVRAGVASRIDEDPFYAVFLRLQALSL